MVQARDHDITIKGKCIDSSDCDGGYGPLLGVCVECMDNCQECSEMRCLLCEPGMVELPDGSCGEVLWDLEPGCDVGRPDRCEKCVGGFDLVDGHCIPVCGPRQWFDSSADEYSCVFGDSTCATVDENGDCITCRVDLTPTLGQGMTRSGSQCVPENCPANCATCAGFEFEREGEIVYEMTCTSCQSGYSLDAETHDCVESACPDHLLFHSDDDSCSECPEVDGVCETCNNDGCLTCPLDHPFLTVDRTCASECPTGQWATDDNRCVPCSEGCNECYSRDVDGDGYVEEVCLECENEKYLWEHRGCVEECPHGTYADDILGWCVKCSCECESCSENKFQCDTCKGPAFKKDDGECVVSW